jgi:tetratricopeptide (TPR) repeat protein
MKTGKNPTMCCSFLRAASFFCVAALVLSSHFCQAASATEDGIAAFAEGDHGKASRSFQLAIDQHGPSAELYFNRGLAAWHEKQTPRAVVSFLRALALDPSQTEAAGALKELAAENNLILPPASPTITLARQIGIGPLWVSGSIISWAAVLLLVVAVFKSTRRGWLIFGGIFLLGFGSTLLAGAYLADPLVSQSNLAVVDAAKPVPARSNPVETAGAVETLPPGSVVGVLSTRGSWTYCELPGGKKGWLNSDSLLAVIPNKGDS